MDITYLGHSAFRIRGKNTTIVTDPYNSESVGLKFPKHIEADIVTISHGHKDHNEISVFDGTPYIVSGPGEYEIKGVGVVGVKRGKNTMYRIEVDGVSIVHLGDLDDKLSAQEIDDLDGVNILMIPVGGVYTIDAAKAVDVIKEIEPNIVIPMHFGRPELRQEEFGQLAPLSVFLKEIGKPDVVPQPKLIIAKDKLPEEMQVVVLE